MAKQVRTVPVAIATIMRSAGFLQGVEDRRLGRAPKYDLHAEDRLWAYERGRLFASIAPIDLPILVKGKLNPAAATMFRHVAKYVP
jgi:hypothetical protein